jgi:hypothetical protein
MWRVYDEAVRKKKFAVREAKKCTEGLNMKDTIDRNKTATVEFTVEEICTISTARLPTGYNTKKGSHKLSASCTNRYGCDWCVADPKPEYFDSEEISYGEYKIRVLPAAYANTDSTAAKSAANDVKAFKRKCFDKLKNSTTDNELKG